MGAKEKQEEVIYILFAKTKKCFFIARGTEETLREIYRHHLKKRRNASENFIKNIEPDRPCIFILEKIKPEENINLLLVWLRILRENRLTSFNNVDLIEQSEHLNYDNMKTYEQRKHFAISEITACNNCLIPTFKKETCTRYLNLSEPESKEKQVPLTIETQRKRTKEIRIRVSEEEKKTIEANAKELEIPVANYVRMVAQKQVIRPYDYSIIDAHTKEIAEIRMCINRLIFTIEATNNYLPKEITTIVNLMSEIFRGENRLLKTLREQQEEDCKKREPYIKE